MKLATKLLWSFLQVISDRLRATNLELSGVRADTIVDLTEELFEIDVKMDED